jgi:uncharacterized membrane protein YvlD (DUF360 family)
MSFIRGFKHLVINIIINSIILFVTSQYIPDLGFTIDGGEQVLVSFVILGVVFWFLNKVVKKIIATVTFPLKYITFGLFNIALNIGVLYAFTYIVNNYLTGITVELGTLIQTAILSLVITLASFILKKIT